MGRRRSRLQRAHSKQAMQMINTRRRENTDIPQPMDTVPTRSTDIYRAEAARQRERAESFERKLRNVSREAARAKKTRDALRAECRHRRLAVAEATKHGAAGAVEPIGNDRETEDDFLSEEKGVIDVNDSGVLFRRLLSLRVPVENINAVIHVVGKAIGVQVIGGNGGQAMGRANDEGEVAWEAGQAAESSLVMRPFLRFT